MLCDTAFDAAATKEEMAKATQEPDKSNETDDSSSSEEER
jgi:hypothetical protein